MEEEVKEFAVESYLGEDEEIDPDYEFDAPRFYDFSQPETYWDAAEAEQWFESAGSYPPSPFVLKLRWRKAIPSEIANTSADCNGKSSNIVDENSGNCMEYGVSAVDSDNRGLNFHDPKLKGKTKSLFRSARSKISTLMKPTASHLAKQRNPSEVLMTPRSFRRSPSQSSSIDGKETKRQKLEAGYLRKTAHLKHHAPFTHKTTKKVDPTDVNLASRPKVTIPKQFDLETAYRAQRHKSRTNNESSGRRKSSSHMFKALPLNKKILEAPSLSFSKKKTPQQTEFHVFHLKTSERATQHTSSNAGHNFNCNLSSNRETRDLRRQNSTDESKQGKCKLVNKHRGSPEKPRLSSKGERGVFRNIKQENVMEINHKRFSNEPPTELFSKLSLASEVKQSTKEHPTSKGLKENRPGNFNLVNERKKYVEEEKHRPCVKQYHQCINERSDISHACMLAGACTFG